MDALEFNYEGEVDIFLQGQNALEPVTSPQALMEYYVGCKASKILIKDHRSKPAKAAKLALNGIEEDGFAKVFNDIAWIEIRSSQDQAEIEIHDSTKIGDVPILYLGVIDDGKMGAYDIDWEIIKPVGETQFAFAALIR